MSPTLARWLMISRWLSSEEACSADPLTRKVSTPPKPLVRYFWPIVERATLQTGVVYALDLGVLLEPLSHFECIVHRSLYAQREGFESLQQQEGVERTLAGTRVAEHFAPCPYGESLVAAVFPEVESVIPFRGFADQGVAAVAPIEVAAVDSHATHAVAVTSDPFGRCVQHDIGAHLIGWQR